MNNIRKVLFVVEDDWTNTLKTFTSGHIAGQKRHESAEKGIYLARFAKPEDYQFGVQGD